MLHFLLVLNTCLIAKNNVFIWMPTIKAEYSLYTLSSVVLLCKFVGSGGHTKPQQMVRGDKDAEERCQTRCWRTSALFIAWVETKGLLASHGRWGTRSLWKHFLSIRGTRRVSGGAKGNGSTFQLLFLKQREMLFPSSPLCLSVEESHKLHTRYHQRLSNCKELKRL